MASRVEDVSVKVAYYKAFGPEPQGFDSILPVNVIVGRNNSGKSTLVDLVLWMAAAGKVGGGPKLAEGGRGRGPEVWLTQPFPTLFPLQVPGRSVEEIHNVTAANWKQRQHPTSWPNIKEFWDDVVVRWKHGDAESAEVVSDHPPELLQNSDLTGTAKQFLRTASRTQRDFSDDFPLKRAHVYRLKAERSIAPESLNTGSMDVGEHGDGATSLLSRFILDFGLDRDVVERRLLRDLNQVFEPDASFSAIHVQRLPDDRHEVFLVEESKGAVALSASGSGLQTVILVLVALNVMPAVPRHSNDLSDWLFAFEELENNLHPALQRRLFWLIRERAVEHGAAVFLTTHSPVVVDLFAEDEHAQIVHVTHDGEDATVTPVLTYASRCGILDDLDVRASDLLQSNGIVWVEGPTDRMYFNRWVQLWTDGDLREGKDYQCVIYGGRLLSHLSVEDPDVELHREAIEVLRVNRNAVFLIDSDKKRLRAPINDTKKRIVEEIKGGGGVAWVTKGREVEHYVPRQTWEAVYGSDVPELKSYDDVHAYIDKAEGKSRKSFDKIRLAEQVVPKLTRELIAGHLDLAERLDETCAAIRSWNSRPVPAQRIVGSEKD